MADQTSATSLDRPPGTVVLSLVSHTNVGKTTLARTLLRRDVGEVRDAPHVTEAAERHTLVALPDEGLALELWDTPGFGDSVRLARQLARRGNPLAWLRDEVWDRWRDRPWWSTQRAVRHVMERSDLVLYLVNAAEPPEVAGHLDAELQVLTLLERPVIVLLNQLGAPRPPDDESAELDRWRARTRGSACVRDVLALDAFARCWVQEDTLLGAVAAALAPARQAAFERLRRAHGERNREVWRASMRALAERLARAALDREVAGDAGWRGRLREWGSAIGLRREGQPTPREAAMARLAERLDADIRASTDSLIRLHGLGGHATETVLLRLAEHYALAVPLDERKAGVLGGAVGGALAGLGADLATGGLTLGGGLLAGGVLGALGALGVARGVNLLRGVAQPTLAWTDAVLDELVRSALIGYLAVAHFGRGRGDWSEGENPAFWADAVDAAVTSRREALHALWLRRERHGEIGELADSLAPIVEEICAGVLARLYPQAAASLANR